MNPTNGVLHRDRVTSLTILLCLMELIPEQRKGCGNRRKGNSPFMLWKPDQPFMTNGIKVFRI